MTSARTAQQKLPGAPQSPPENSDASIQWRGILLEGAQTKPPAKSKQSAPLTAPASQPSIADHLKTLRDQQPPAPVVQNFPAAPLSRPNPAQEEQITKLTHLLDEEKAARAKAEHALAQAQGRNAQLDQLQAELQTAHKALAELRQSESRLQQEVKSAAAALADQKALTQKLKDLRAQLLAAEAQIATLSARPESSHVEEMLQQAQKNVHLEYRKQLREAEAIERRLQQQTQQLKEELQALRHSSAASQTALQGNNEWLNSELSTSREEISRLQEELGIAQAANSSEARLAIEAELASAKLKLADLTGFDREPSLESRHILVETLESELARLRKQLENLPQGLETSPKGTPNPWSTLHEHTRKRITILQDLISESLLFLRRRQAEASENHQPDQQSKDPHPESDLQSG